MTCVVCGTVAVPGARFCHACGAALSATTASPATERRVVTVLFGDLSDFTGWAEDLDPERVGAVTDRILAALAQAVTTFGGHVDKLTGDGIMAVFGAPVAHEDDAERALRAALAMQRAVRRVLDATQGGGLPLGLRVGLNTGVVVAGVQAALEYTVVGDTVNTAARLADAAAVGSVYAGASTATTTRRIAAWRQLRPLRLKGKREPVEAYELLGLHDAPGTRSGLGDEGPFVGRETDMALFASRLGEVVDRGEPRALLLTAEAGVGKTRFAAEAARHAAESGARVLSVRCAAYGEQRRLAPLADLVRQAAGLGANGGNTVDRATAEERLCRIVGRLCRPSEVPGGGPRVDLLLALLGFGELPSRRPRRPATPSGEGGDVDAVPGTVADLLSVMARESPLVIMVDDMHAATAGALRALGASIANLAGPVLVLLLGRPEVVRTNGVLTLLPDAEVHALAPLRGAHAARLLTAYLAGGRLPQADEDRLLSTAQGNPFYLAELVTLLIERGLLTGGRDGWRLAPGSLAGRLLSHDLAAVLAARIDALPPEVRAVLRDAAVVGDTVPEGALAALRNAPRGAVATVELERAIDELLARRMLRRMERGGFAFVTPLMRQAAYAGAGKANLADRHARLARWADEHLPGPSVPQGEADAFVADHAERAVLLANVVGLAPDVDPRRVSPLGVSALGRLARQALASGEPAQAARLAERAAALSGGTLSVSDRLIHARALLQLGRAGEARGYIEKAVANAGSPEMLVTARLLAGEAYRALGESDRASETWREALAGAQAASLAAEQAEALCRLGMADYLSGRLREAEQRFAAAQRVSVEAGDRRGQAWALQHLAWVTTSRGDFIAADQTLGRAARLFAELDDPIGRAWVRGTTAFTRLLAGRLGEARRLAKAFLPFGERVGETWAVGTLRSVAAFAAAALGELGEADREARRAYREFDANGDDWGRGFALLVRGAIAQARREPQLAISLLDAAERFGARTGHPMLVGIARTIRGYCHLAIGDPVAAEQAARMTLDLAEPLDVLPAATVGPVVLLAEARRAQGDVPGAVVLLEDIVSCCPAGASLLFPRRQAVASYAGALLADGQVEKALRWARKALEVAGEDARSQVVALRVCADALAASGDHAGAVGAATRAVDLAYATEHIDQRADSDALLAKLTDSMAAVPAAVPVPAATSD